MTETETSKKTSAHTAHAHAPAPAQQKPRKRRPIAWLLALLLIGGTSWWAVRFTHHALNFETTDDAYIRGHIHQVSSRVAGSVSEVLVVEHEAVKAGQVLARIDAAEFKIALERAQAALAQAKAEELESKAALARTAAQGAQMTAQVKQAEAQVAQSGAEQETANLNLRRNQTLFQGESRAISKADVDTARGTAESMRAALDGAKASVESARAQEQAAQAAIDAARAKLEATQATVNAQAAAVRDAERELSYTEVKAPADGHIGSKSVEPGDRVQMGQALFAVVEPQGWIVANFKETQLKKMQIGQPVEITVDAIDGRTFQGHVASFAPATGAQFALLPPDNASGNFTKVVQRVPVKITFDAESVKGVEERLQAGLSVVVDVKIR